MNKKTQKQQKQTNNLNKFLAKNNTSQDKSSTLPIQKNQGKKKINPPPSNTQASKDKAPSPPALPKKIQIQHLLKEIQVEQVLRKSPKLQQLVVSLASRVALGREIIIGLLKKYLHSSPLSLWSRRYAPKQISELFNVAAGIKIKEWIDAFFEYKNKIIEEDSFINEIEQQKSCTIYRKIRENQWQLQALIVRGRPGIGKTSAIRAVANQMDIDLQQCGNEYNHTKYLKQKNESTQSQSVKTAYIRKPKIEKNAQMITKFISFVQKQKPKQNKKSQMIHNISKIFPESEASKFYSELSKCVQFSKIPFIMTNSGEKLPKECERYDLIQFDSGETELIQTFLWLIYHLECLICLNKRAEIQKESLFQELNAQVAQLQFKELCSISKVREICELFNYRLDYIFTFLQHEKTKLNSLDIFPLLIKKYKNLNEDQLLEEILFIDFQRLRIAGPLSLSAEKLQKIDDHNNTQDSSQSQKIKDQKEYSLDTYRRMVKLAAAQDALVNIQQGNYIESNSLDLSEWQDYPYTCIDVNVHRGIKVSLAKMANSEINCTHEKMRSSLKPSELYYLPMMIREKRANRSSRISIDGLKKVYDANELCYLQNFGHLLKLQ